MRAVRDRSARARGRYVNHFRQLVFGYTSGDGFVADGSRCNRTLRRERDRHQLFVFLRNGAVGQRELVPGAEGVHGFRREFADMSQLAEIRFRVNGSLFLSISR